MKKILVLEDEANIRSFVVINLRRSGYEPIEAETGEQALEQLKQNPDIKVALLDVMLPDIDGFEVCRRIRASGSRMGIIMLTAKGEIDDKMMYNTYNMGLGMVLAVAKEDVAKVIAAVEAAGEKAYEVGYVESGDKGVSLC